MSEAHRYADLLVEVSGFACPICLFPDLMEPYEDCSYNICPSCGTEYGYDDCMPRDANYREKWQRRIDLRLEWINRGDPWWFKREPCPAWWPAIALAKQPEPPQ